MTKTSTIILDDDSPAARSDTAINGWPHPGAEWGFASSTIGAIFLIMGPVALLFCLNFWNHGKNNDHGLSLQDLRMAEIGSVICVAGAEILCLTGLFFGLKGLGLARLTKNTPALPLTGALLCAGAMVMWLIVAIDLLMIVNTFLRWKEELTTLP